MSNAVLNAAQMETQSRLNSFIETVLGSEKITRDALKEFSRDCLLYVMETHDIEIVNRMVGVLTVNNAKRFVEYANNFLPWVSEKDENKNHVRFGKMQAGHIVVKAQKKQAEFLSDANNNFWTWSQEIDPPKAKDLLADMNKAIKNAAHGTKTTQAVPMQAVLAAIVSHPDFDIEAALALITEPAQEETVVAIAA